MKPLLILCLIVLSAVAQAKTKVVDYQTWIDNGQGASIVLSCTQPLDGIVATKFRSGDRPYAHLVVSVHFSGPDVEVELPDGTQLTVQNYDCREMSADGLPSPH